MRLRSRHEHREATSGELMGVVAAIMMLFVSQAVLSTVECALGVLVPNAMQHHTLCVFHLGFRSQHLSA